MPHRPTPSCPPTGGLRLWLLLWLLVGLGACGRPPAVEPLRIGINPWPGYELIHVAQEQGYFDAEGLTVEIVELSSLGDSRRAFERGQTDIFGATPAELLFSQENAPRQAQAFYLMDYSAGADVIVGRPSIATLADLRGRRVGAEPASMDLALLTFALQSAGLSLSDVNLVPIQQNSLLHVLRDGQLDAAVSYPPYSQEIQRLNLARPIFDSLAIPGRIVDFLAADARLLNQRPDDFKALVRALDRARLFIEQHPDQAYPGMAQREQVSLDELRDAMSGIRLIPLNEQGAFFGGQGTFTETLSVTAATLRQAGLLSRRHSPEALQNPAIVAREARP